MKHWLLGLLLAPFVAQANCGGDGGLIVLGWLDTDFSKCSLHFDSLVETGPGKDGVPSIERPRFGSLADSDIPFAEPVLVVTVEEITRAYPIRILMWHQIVNDRIGDVDLVVTFDPLTNAALVFERRVGDEVLDFGTTGYVRGSSMVMYDRQTESWWQHYTGRGIAGEYNDQALSPWLSQTISFQRLTRDFPDAEVMVPFDPIFREYGTNPYVSYDSSAIPFLYPGQLPQTIGPMEYVLVAEGVAVNASLLRRTGFVEHEGHQWFWEPGMASALDDPEIARGRDLGMFRVERDGVKVNHHLVFAFVFHAFADERLIRVD